MSVTEARADILVVGGSLGGVAAALAACRTGASVILAEETDWLGGQLTTQAVSHLDDHPWIEQFGCTASYRQLRQNIRDYYRSWYPLTSDARSARFLNPGAATVSALVFEPRVAVAVLEAMLAPFRSSGQLRVWPRHKPVRATTLSDSVAAITLVDQRSGDAISVTADYFLDGTDTGELLPFTDTEFVTGAEARRDTNEPHAAERADPLDMQAITWCFVVDYVADADHTIARPEMYDYWKNYRDQEWPNGPLSWTVSNWIDRSPLTYRFEPNPVTPPSATGVKVSSATDTVDADLWLFRRIAARLNFLPGSYRSDITLVNWGMNDYFAGPVYALPEADVAGNLHSARQLSLSLLYWLQTEAPRTDGGVGYPGLRLRGDLLGTDDGLAKRPYVRESRRIRAQCTVVEQDLALEVRKTKGAVRYHDSVGIGSYRLDLHPSSNGGKSMEIPALPFYIPLGALVPQRVLNLLPASKNIGTTHITNACYRLHHVEWNVGEAAGLLPGFCLSVGCRPRDIRDDPQLLSDFQHLLVREGVELAWPTVGAY
jgi:hypothetical protein